VNLLAAVLLGIIQGITEFLPVSSSAHLILARAFFGWEVPPELGLAFDVALHLGTLVAILIYFRTEIFTMVRAIPDALSFPLPAAGVSARGDSARIIHLIVTGTIPIVIVGLAMTDAVETRLRQPAVAAGALAFGAMAMMVAERLGARTRVEPSLRWWEAVLIGCAQAAALIPGMSRSGSTIVVGMFLGVRRDAAARFTFLLAIPATLAAAGKEALELRHMALGADVAVLFVVGLMVSAIVGYLTIRYFLRFLAGHTMDVFAYYRFALAAATVVWLWRH
jgi:undecaprenyl-diphosphatase